MSKLTNFIKGLSDRDLVNFYLFRYQTFMHASKDVIDEELGSRGITPKRISEIRNEPTIEDTSGDLCSRCGARHFYHSDEEVELETKYGSSHFDVKMRQCLICNYSADKEELGVGNSRSFVSVFSKLVKLVGRSKKS